MKTKTRLPLSFIHKHRAFREVLEGRRCPLTADEVHALLDRIHPTTHEQALADIREELGWTD